MGYRIKREILLDSRRVNYILELKAVKNINISVTPEKGLYVSAPYNSDITQVEKCLKSISNKILYALNKYTQTDKNKTSIEITNNKKKTIMLNNTIVEYELEFKKIKRINLSIRLGKGIHVSAPLGTSISTIERFMSDNSKFIFDTLEKHRQLAETLPEPKKYENGEYIYFLGEKKRLSLTSSDRNFAEIKSNEIRLFVTDTDNFELKETIIYSFIKNECENYVVNLCKELYPKFSKKGIPFPKEIRFRRMVSCWGNCRPERKIITFNTHLIQLPPKCIEAVICHEFTHFLHANHSKDFYSQLTEFMPDWRTYDKTIRELQKEIIIKKSNVL